MDAQEMYDIGFPFLEKIAEMNSSKICKIVKDIVDDKSMDNFFNNCNVIKHIKNDKFSKIILVYYSTYEISPFGITYKSEKDEVITIVKFNKYFKLPEYN